MRAIGVLCLMLWASVVAAQSENNAALPRPSSSRPPLANLNDIEPAVDVGGPRLRDNAQQEKRVAVAKAFAPGPTPPKDQRGGVRETQTVTGTNPSEAGATRRAGGRAMDTLDLGTTSITGNQELPKVLYIVPWKKSDLGDLVGRPVNTLLDEVLEPVDPEVFQRQLEYYRTLHGDSAKE